MTSKTNNALAIVRQLAALGQPPATIFDELVGCLKDIVRFDTASIILLGEDFSGRDAFANFDLPVAVSTRYAERWFNRDEGRYYPDHIRLQTDPALKDIALVRQSRLSVMPVSDAHWSHIGKLGGLPGA